MRSLKTGALSLGICSLMLAAVSANGPSKTTVTFTKDVAPILYNRCVNCHRPGEAGPMPLRTYQEARPWAKAIKEAVSTRTMPPMVSMKCR